MGHYKTVCRECKTVISQCRCLRRNKEVVYDLCEKCKGQKKTNQPEWYERFNKAISQVTEEDIKDLFNSEKK